MPEGITPEQKEDLTFNLEDIGFELQDKSLFCYEEVQRSLKQFSAENSTYAGKVMQALARLNPQKYGKSFFMPISFVTGSDWYARSDSIAGWNTKQVPANDGLPVAA